MTLGDLKCAVCGQPAVGVCQVFLSLPCSEAYCETCLRKGIDPWWVVVCQVSMLLDRPDGMSDDEWERMLSARGWRDYMAPWAVGVIDRSLEFHGKSEAELLAAAMAELVGDDEEQG